jgi:hypothetical protein
MRDLAMPTGSVMGVALSWRAAPGTRSCRWSLGRVERAGTAIRGGAQAAGGKAVPGRPATIADVALAALSSALPAGATGFGAPTLTAVDVTALAEDERRQIASWNPPTVGHVLFDFRD